MTVPSSGLCTSCEYNIHSHSFVPSMDAPKPVIVKDPMHSALRQEKIAANFRALSGLLQEACGVDLNSLTPDVLLPPRVGPVTRRAAVASATLAKPASSAVRSGGSKSSTKQAVRDETMEVITLRPRNDKVRSVFLRLTTCLEGGCCCW